MAKLEVGSLLADRYEIISLLGRGGMGMVYHVKDWQTQQDLALKTLLPKYAKNTQAARRFAREVAAARQLDHPCVVKIFDARQHEDLLYYTMEYLEGKSLRALMKNRKKRGQNMGLGSTVRILSLICHALEHAHKVTIHRDISPENVMVMPNGDVKLLDFGLAKLTTMDSNLTRIGVSLGKIQYSAPEQRMDAKNVDHRADIYSLGVMFFEMLSGELPLGSSNLRSLAKDLPPEVDHLVTKTIAPDPEDRYDSAEEFRLALLNIYQRSTGKGIEVISEEAHVEEVAQEEQQVASEEQNVDDTLPVFTAMQDNRNIFMRLYYKIKTKFFGQPTNFDNTFKKD